MRPSILLFSLLAAGCQEEEATLVWLEGFGFGWTIVNHRLSYVHFDADEDGVDYAVIGGASSTGYAPELPTGCDEDLCGELEFEDSTSVEIAWGTTTTRMAHGSTLGSVLATPSGGETELTIPLSRTGEGEPAALLQSLVLDTDHALAGGDSCYIPSLGWHPRRIAVELADPTLSSDGESLNVTLRAHFEAGLSFEEYRACQDEVVGEEQVLVTVEVLGLVSPDGVQQRQPSHDMAYEFSGNSLSPEEQPDPELSDRPLTLEQDPAIVGWSAFDFHFHEQDETMRGAYLRSWSVDMDVEQGWASGHATNYSPGTQLSEFTYTFSGTVTAVPTEAEVEHHRSVFDEVEAELDDDDRPVVHHEVP